MTKKYEHRINTMDGIIEVEDDVPPSPLQIKTPEEMEEERERLYPNTESASYLQYV
jgi:hypothetical protein